MTSLYQSVEEIEKLVRDFEICALADDDFHHREHLIVAVWYLQKLSRDEAVARMRAGLLRFLDHHGVDPQKYSEEITVFWIDAVATKLEKISANASLTEKCNQVISAFNSPAFNSPTRTPTALTEVEESLEKS